LPLNNPSIVVSKFGSHADRAPRVPERAHFLAKGSHFASLFPSGNYLTPSPLAIKDSRRVHFHRILTFQLITFPYGNMVHLLWTATKPRLIAGLRRQHPASAR